MSSRSNKYSGLLAKIRKGDQESFELLYNEEFEKIYRFVIFKVSDQTLTEEIVQDIFFSFWDYARQGGKIDNPVGLLYKIARNKIIDYYRKSGVRPKVISLDSHEGYEISESQVSGSDIEKELDVSFKIESIQAVMVELPDDYRDILIMRFMREMEMKEIAEAMEKSEGAVRVMIYRALKLLKKIADKQDE